MKIEKELLKTLAHSADIVNTINGGMSLALVRKTQEEDHFLVTVKVPGVDVDALKLEMSGSHLFVFQMMHVQEGVDVPYLVAGIEVEEQVNMDEVRAHFQNNQLTIMLPFGPIDSREISITHD